MDLRELLLLRRGGDLQQGRLIVLGTGLACRLLGFGRDVGDLQRAVDRGSWLAKLTSSTGNAALWSAEWNFLANLASK